MKSAAPHATITIWPSCCSRSRPTRCYAANTAKRGSGASCVSSSAWFGPRPAASTRWLESATAGFAWSSRKPTAPSPSARRSGSAPRSKSIPMPRCKTATSSASRWTLVSLSASVARTTVRHCWRRRSIAWSSPERSGACAASNPERVEASIVVRMRVLIAGGSGYIGRRLAGSLAADRHDIVSLSRRPERAPSQSGVRFVKWDARTAEGDWVNELAGAQGIINLAGASIGKGRWTRRRMEEILSSRLSATSAIVEAVNRTPADRRPSVLVNASGIDYYGNRGDELVTEESGPGDSFLARVSQQWEAAARQAQVLGAQSQLLLDGRHAVPARARAAGYPFRFAGLHEALEDTLRAR